MKTAGFDSIDSTRALPIVAELGLELWENANTRERDVFVSPEHFVRMAAGIEVAVDYRKLRIPPAITVEQWAAGRVYVIPPPRAEYGVICPNCGCRVD